MRVSNWKEKEDGQEETERRADALGLTAVHVNRVMRELREGGLVTFQHGQVTFDDFEALVRLADYDKNYLDHGGPMLK